MHVDTILVGAAIASPCLFVAIFFSHFWVKYRRKYARLKRTSRALLATAEKARSLMNRDVVRCNAHLHRIVEILQGSRSELGVRCEAALANTQAFLDRVAANPADVSTLEHATHSLHETVVILRELNLAYELYLQDSTQRQAESQTHP